MMATAVSGRLPEHFPEPEKFRPERWCRKSEEPPNPFMSLPFGFGRRMCIGKKSCKKSCKAVIMLEVPYCYYYKRVLILANIGDLVITAKFCARY